MDISISLIRFSSAAKAVYAADSRSGRVFAIDARGAKVSAQIDARPGVAQIRFAPGGRYALLANPQQNVVQVLDAATNRIVKNADVDAGPDRVSFTEQMAYVHRRGSETVVMIPLPELGTSGAIGVSDFPAGQHALGDSGLADSIVTAPDGPAVIVANPTDRMIYFYKEGMAAPMGGFQNYQRTPRAVLVVDHGLREQARGRYLATLPVHGAGTYDVALLVESPRVIACFTMNVGADPNNKVAQLTRVVAIDPPAHLAIGKPARLRFALSDKVGAARMADDVRALVFEAPGVWQHRTPALRSADGRYEIDFVPPEAGTYYVWIESAALGLDRRNSQFSIYQAD